MLAKKLDGYTNGPSKKQNANVSGLTNGEPEVQDVNFVNYNRGGNYNPYSNSFDPGWRNHEIFKWRQDDQSSELQQNGGNQTQTAQVGAHGQSRGTMEEDVTNTKEFTS